MVSLQPASQPSLMTYSEAVGILLFFIPPFLMLIDLFLPFYWLFIYSSLFNAYLFLPFQCLFIYSSLCNAYLFLPF